MTAKIIDGKQVAAEIRAELKTQVQQLRDRGIIPGLGVILVGDDPASKSYVTAKEKACEEIGLFSDDNRLPAATSQAELMARVRGMNADPKIHGILVQLPLPKHLNETEVLLAIDPDKDVDGFHPMNIGRMVLGQKAFLPCTPHGVVQLLVRSGVKLKGAHVVIVGRSNIVGKPLASMLMQKNETANATVTLCHTGTKDIGYFTRQADVIVAATGRPNTITADMVMEGAVVIDVGVNRINDPSKKNGFRLVGDVDYKAVKEKAGLITPVPGGVGPMTITMLLFNTVESAGRTAHD
ncbi:MAG: bifunctional methylenetetrahydrofolate dehydrogenase/methenyltetrahydrofolate cyclohydrolase FolD [Verrucomicrobia bacterium]|nr:bifunctional methylenetetrahydrofolate dehydrogenase/methenyltetrahydrofolate cyclohydrolase FolD [Verrucomicrobiota bacterium]MBU4246889.1 bifunctional methylenetetrahydrofolate dehydrogenase/methenyltetrahydrofolate cyclohydrolase FolD [Verrucomicrobiota bacterium]MBU4290832.1 bifunctional methylenetetrahydrofolate dehydrogenase/methenyltetrahydrofolate cyclohydrolase FolD [Verrucomicrobiota bacterium]MBU4496568.1 bifunctional methylenetetrahydrofolate dehydrogenase/methenyltetrahydrofolate